MLGPCPVREDRGRVGLCVADELIDAWAVLADRDAVGGPEEKIDLGGVLNNDGWLWG